MQSFFRLSFYVLSKAKIKCSNYQTLFSDLLFKK